MTMEFNNLVETLEHSFGMWINGLWGNMLFDNREWSFCEQKEAFFILLRRLLEEGRVKFVQPEADVYYNATLNPHPRYTINDPEAHWEAPPEEIIAYLQEHWPNTATDKDDADLNAYFYRMPAIIWKGEDGKFYGS